MKAKEYIDKILDRLVMGEETISVLEFIESGGSSIMSALAIRKRLRKEAPKVFAYLDQVGLVQDFAADLSSGTKGLEKLVKLYDIPKNISKELDNFV